MVGLIVESVANECAVEDAVFFAALMLPQLAVAVDTFS